MKMKTKTNIDVSLIKTQKYEKNIKNEAIKNENILKKPGKKRNKIYKFFSINESKICNKISKIPVKNVGNEKPMKANVLAIWSNKE